MATRNELFADPIHVETTERCRFYHTLTLRTGERLEGQWELNVDDYLGHVDFSGKLALDVGTASGALVWAMEERGAEVIGYDLSIDAEWDVIPSVHDDHVRTVEERKQLVSELQRGWWYCRERNQSNARAVYGHVYDIPVALGPVDVSVLGAILLHLRDPFRALQAAARITGETIIVTDLVPSLPAEAADLPVALLMPDLDTGEHIWTWWHLTPELVMRMLRFLGFADSSVSFHRQQHFSGVYDMFTVVANRTLPYDPSRGF